MTDITVPAPLPLGWRRVLKSLKLIGCMIAFCAGCKMFDVGIAKLSGDMLEAWEEKFLFSGATILYFFAYVGWKTRAVNGIVRPFVLAALASCTLAALSHYEWRWFAHATTGILGMFVVLAALGIMSGILEKRA